MAKPLSKTVVVAYGRSAVAKSGKKGALRNLHPIDTVSYTHLTLPTILRV